MEKNAIYKIPETLTERRMFRSQIADFIGGRRCTLPLSMPELMALCTSFMEHHDADPAFFGWLMVEIHNSLWKDIVAAIPCDRRILLLPQCLRSFTKCRAEIDELGLLCHLCGHCHIPDLQQKADRLNMMSIVAEGFTSVIPLIENRSVDAVIGVSCLDSLEKAFPLLIDNAVPGLAIPLNKAGCKDTTVDEYYVEEMMEMFHPGKPLLDHGKIRASVTSLFEKEPLDSILTKGTDQTTLIAREWLGDNGKRWRPFLVAATGIALSGEDTITDPLKWASVAVECFHKASLVHDDIQDHDQMRYGKPTVYAQYGVPVAINVGDFLLGEGYRLLSMTGNGALLRMASEAHIALCKGQGLEMEWCAAPKALDMDFVLRIFSLKTVPAFDVALMMGVLLSGGSPDLQAVLHDYSDALGIAYQLLDDVEDYSTEGRLELRPSAILAALCEANPDATFEEQLFHANDLKTFLTDPARSERLDAAIHRVKSLADQYHERALDALSKIDNMELKRLLFRVTRKILKK